MNTPNGLTRFSRTINAKQPRKVCEFCNAAIRVGVAFASVDASGQWHNTCTTCAASIVAQVKAVVRRLDAASQGLDATDLATVAAMLPESNVLAAAMTDGALDTIAYDALVKLQAAFAALTDATKPAVDTDMLTALQAIAANPQAQPRDRDFAASLARHLSSKGALTPAQAPHADRLVARFANGGTPAPAVEGAGEGLYLHDDGTVRRIYMTQNDRLGCRVLTVHTHDGHSHGNFDYEKGGRRIVSEALAAGTAHKMTQDEARAFGRLHCFCCNCARDLNDDRSVAAGYGPDCADNNGWHYPSYEEASVILGRPVTNKQGKVIG